MKVNNFSWKKMYSRRLTESTCVGRLFESVCLSVCLEHNSKTNDHKLLKVFKRGIGNDIWIF